MLVPVFSLFPIYHIVVIFHRNNSPVPSTAFSPQIKSGAEVEGPLTLDLVPVTVTIAWPDHAVTIAESSSLPHKGYAFRSHMSQKMPSTSDTKSGSQADTLLHPLIRVSLNILVR
jgi:hypothetical protein